MSLIPNSTLTVVVGTEMWKLESGEKLNFKFGRLPTAGISKA